MNLNLKHFGAFVCVCLCLCVSLSAKVVRTPVYIFGFSASFTDSVAYITDIQRMDSTYIETKGDFLIDRVVYSDQLQTYLESMKGMKNSTCVVFFHTKKKNLQDEYDKIRKRYEKDGSVILKTMDGEPFRFYSPAYQPVMKKNAAEKKDNKPKKAKERKKAGTDGTSNG